MSSETAPSSSRSTMPSAAEAGTAFPGASQALLLYALLTIVLTWPLAIHLTDRLPHGNNDLWQNYWNFWWWKTALLDLHASPYVTDLLYQPAEVSLAVHTHSPANVLFWLPVTALFGEAAALNCATLLGFLLTAWGGYFLAYEICRHRGAAFVAGYALAFTAQHFEQSLEHLNLASYQAMPFFVYFLVRVLQYGGLANTLGTAGFFATNALYSWHNGVLIVPLALGLAVHALVRRTRPWRPLCRDLAAAALLGGVLVLPFLWPLLAAISAGETFVKAPVSKGVDLLFLIIPTARHPLWGGLFEPLYDAWRRYPSAGFTCYLGGVSLAVAAAALRRRGTPPPAPRGAGDGGARPDAFQSPRLWACAGGLYLVFALGSTLVVAGRELDIPLPFRLLDAIPLLNTLRVANRFVIPGVLALSVLVALGVTVLVRTRSGTFGSLLFALLVIDTLWLPYPLRERPRPQWITPLRAAPPGLLLNVPGGYRARAAEDMYLQTLHGRPLVGGYTSVPPRHMEERVESLPFLRVIFEGEPPVAVTAALDIPAGLARVLEALPVRVVAVHLSRRRELLVAERERQADELTKRLYNPAKGIPAAQLDAIREALRQRWGEPFYADDAVELFAAP